jgi:hypothetical protein
VDGKLQLIPPSEQFTDYTVVNVHRSTGGTLKLKETAALNIPPGHLDQDATVRIYVGDPTGSPPAGFRWGGQQITVEFCKFNPDLPFAPPSPPLPIATMAPRPSAPASH